MTSLLITTPGYLLRYDLAEGRTYIIEDERPEYYGISWFAGDSNLVLSHSGLDNSALLDFEAYAHSEVGWLSHGDSECWRFLSQPHQILCVGDHQIVATNTGRNCITIVNRRDWSIRHFRFNAVLWDRLDSQRSIGNHFNSLFFRDDRLYVLAHNFSKGCFVEELEWETFQPTAITRYSATELHNLWIRDDGLKLSCFSPRGALIDLSTERIMWVSNDPDCYTRGMASSAENLFIGASEKSLRGGRRSGQSGIWIIDTESFVTRGFISLGPFGAVHDVRVVDAVDACHQNGLLMLTSELQGERAETLNSRRKLALVRRVFLNWDEWDVPIGSFEMLDDGSLNTTGDDLCLAALRNVCALDVRLCANLDLSQVEGHIGMVARYTGPGDMNMVAASFYKTGGRPVASVWRNDNGQWVTLSHAVMDIMQGSVEVLLRGGDVEVIFDGAIILKASLPAPFTVGSVGIRGIKGGLTNFRYEAMEN
jgi:hypothetical protein